MSAKKYVHLVFLVAMIIFSWFFIKATDLVWSYFARPSELWVNFIGILLGIGSVAYYWRKEEVFEQVEAVVSELSRVTWPTREETSSATVVVIITVFIAAGLMGFFDFFWAVVTDWILLS